MVGSRERAAEGLQVGDSFRTSRTFTGKDVNLFVQISKDYNPVHFDARNITTVSTWNGNSVTLHCQLVMRSFRPNKGA